MNSIDLDKKVVRIRSNRDRGILSNPVLSIPTDGWILRASIGVQNEKVKGCCIQDLREIIIPVAGLDTEPSFH